MSDDSTKITGDTEVRFSLDNDRKIVIKAQEGVEISDGFHTMSELYKHRYALFIALCLVLDSEGLKRIWKSRVHSDGSPMYPGWFLAGIGREKGYQITYHLPMTFWDDFKHEEMEVPPLYDGHTSDDVIERLMKLFK